MGPYFSTWAVASTLITCFSASSDTLPATAGEVIHTASVRSSSFESSRFRVHCLDTEATANAMANRCEQICHTIHVRLVGKEPTSSWKPKCLVVVHATRASYLRAVGMGGGQTVGSSLVRTDRGQVVERRIDILAEDHDKGMAALPHEIVHVLLADWFPSATLPHWAEEGLATREDDAEKKLRHLRDLHHALQTNTALSLPVLFSENSYPTGAQRAAFYGQSLSVVDYLSQRRDPDQFLRFVREFQAHGYDRALAAVYGIQSVRELEHDWRRHVTSQLTAIDLSAN